LKASEIAALFDLSHHAKGVDAIFARVFEGK
jgi:hydroxyethylthiazole kinase-like sugar kinase family protein